ncbi:Ubiquinone biosynthesis O-methyltransferase [Actinomadura rubteroloni]|uniref:Ubiquinone biosynthesis O-methyltransferase n=1 Tax=Actinomadura rubteroloni TaxID=1926885 RepID=A0A2P4UFT4_9ACTN|nr:class I SAM-dependent methyltransferase [Actinomadura rubteroloni]POM23913.1 Ubiquinone biosynthesis O-methyltransferase [Actinomadura rubteroloni]
MDEPWNHNVHYHPLVVGFVPDGCGRALDVGCGDGTLIRKLAARARDVTGVDRSPEMIAAARARCGDLPHARFAETDFPGTDPDLFAPGSYDFISAVAVLHHLDLPSALRAMAGLLAPGGRLAIIGLARTASPLDWVLGAAQFPAVRVVDALHGGARTAAAMPVRDPREPWSEVRRTSRRVLPGSRFRRHLLWRYSLLWQKP